MTAQTVFDQFSSEKQREIFRLEVEKVCKECASPEESEELIAKAFFQGVQSNLDDEKPPGWDKKTTRETLGPGQLAAFSSGYFFASELFTCCKVANPETYSSRWIDPN